MKVTAGVVQMDVRLGDVSGNLARAVSGLRRLAGRGVNLAALPEMWSAGFDYPRLTEHAERTPELLERLAREARELGLSIVGSLPESTPEGVANSSFFVDEKGVRRPPYRKVHLFSPTGEDRRFAAGDRAVVLDTPLGRIGLIICYDLRFPEIARKTAEMGAEILVIPAQWPVARARHWDVLATARAVENQVFVIAANRCGADKDTLFAGRSKIVSPWGNILARAGKRPATISASLDFGEMASFREKIPCWRDRKSILY